MGTYIKGGVKIMRISTLNLFLKDALKNLRRNSNRSISTITTVMSTLFILGIFLLFMLNRNYSATILYKIYVCSKNVLPSNILCI